MAFVVEADLHAVELIARLEAVADNDVAAGRPQDLQILGDLESFAQIQMAIAKEGAEVRTPGAEGETSAAARMIGDVVIEDGRGVQAEHAGVDGRRASGARGDERRHGLGTLPPHQILGGRPEARLIRTAVAAPSAPS